MIQIFQRVTKDEKRLVIAEADSITELADIIGRSVSAVSHGIHAAERNPERTGCYQVTWIDEEDE